MDSGRRGSMTRGYVIACTSHANAPSTHTAGLSTMDGMHACTCPRGMCTVCSASVARPRGQLCSAACSATGPLVKERSIEAGNVIARAMWSQIRPLNHSCSAGALMMSTPPSILSDRSICGAGCLSICSRVTAQGPVRRAPVLARDCACNYVEG